MTPTYPNRREYAALRALSLGSVEDPADMPGIGARTLAEMLSKGWIERARDETYGVEGFRITGEGKAALRLL